MNDREAPPSTPTEITPRLDSDVQSDHSAPTGAWPPYRPPVGDLVVPNGLPSIPGYELLDELGRGGMGVVYRARHIELGRTVVIKMIRPGRLDSQHLARFQAEARAVAGLNHSNIVQVYDVGRVGELPYMVMELCAGGSLADRLERPLAPADAARMVCTLARAIHAAHQAGILHRDLKPANVLLASEGRGPPPGRARGEGGACPAGAPRPPLAASGGSRPPLARMVPKVSDFGLARRLEEDSGLTRTGDPIGTPAYMAPEQAMGRKDMGPAADIWALGAILYECLIGRPPFLGATVLETIEMVRDRDPVPPRALNAGVPRDLETITLKCLQKAPEKRYAAATELADDLGRFLDGQPIHARPTTALERAWKWARRRPAVAGLLALLVTGGLVALGVVTLLWRQATQAEEQARHLAGEEALARARAERAEAEERAGRQRAEKAETATRLALEESDRLLYLRHINLAADRWSAGAVRDVERLLQLCPEPGHGPEWHLLRGYLRQADASVVSAAVPWAGAVAFSPDSKLLAEARGELITLRNVASRRVRQTIRAAGEVQGLAWALNGTLLIGTVQPTAKGNSAPALTIWRIPQGEVVATLRGWRGAAVAPSGAALLSDAGQGQAVLWDFASARKIELGGHQGAIPHLAWSAGGRQVATADGHGTIRVWDLRPQPQPGPMAGLIATAGRGGWASAMAFHLASTAPRLVVRRTPHRLRITGLALDPSGRYFISTSGDQTARVYDLTSGTEPVAPYTSTDSINALACRPDGRAFAIAGLDGAAHVIDRGTGSRLALFRGHTGVVHSLAYSPDGRWLATSGQDGTVRLHDATRPPGPARWQAGRGPVYSVVFSDDGQWLAWTARGGRVLLRDRRSGTDRTLYTYATEAVRLAFGPGGKWVVSGDARGNVVVQELPSGKVLHQLAGTFFPVMALAPAPDGRAAAVSWMSGQSGLLDVRTGKLMPQPVDDKGARGVLDHFMALTYSRDGKEVIAARASGEVVFWAPQTGRLLRRVKLDSVPLVALARSGDGTLLACAGAGRGGTGEVRLLDRATGRERHVLQGPAGMIRAIAFSSDDRFLATGGNDGTVRLWDRASGAEVLCLREHRHAVLTVAFSPDGRALATADSDGEVHLHDLTPGPERLTVRSRYPLTGTIWGATGGLTTLTKTGLWQQWDGTTGKPAGQNEAHPGGPTVLASGRDRFATLGRDERVRLWKADGSLVASWQQPGPASALALHPADQRLAIGDDNGKVWLVRVDTGKVERSFDAGNQPIRTVCFSPDGKRLAAGSAEGVRVWPLESKQAAPITTRLAGKWVVGAATFLTNDRLAVALDTGGVFLWDIGADRWNTDLATRRAAALARSPDGTLLAIGERRGDVVLIEVATMRPRATLRGHGGVVTSLSFDSAGRRLVSTSDDGTARVWAVGDRPR